MKKGKRFINNKTKLAQKYLFLILIFLTIIVGISLLQKNKLINIENSSNKILGNYMKEEIEKLMNEDDENLVSNKYLVTDTSIEKIAENTKIEDFKKNFEKEIKIYEDNVLTKEITEGIIKTGMVAEDRGSIYTLVVSGDVNKDGLVNQIDISKIIRGEMLEESTLKASEIGIEKIENKIVFGKFEIGNVKEVDIPEIEIVEGELGKNDWYTSDVKIKVHQKDEEGTKTVYKIKGTEEKETTEITENETITLDKDGVYKVIAYTYGEEGNKSRIAQKIIKINKTGIEATINYSPNTETTETVTATITFNKEGITITNNEGKNSHEFTENGEFVFTYEDEMGRTGSITAKVEWIKKEEIVGQDGEWKYFINKDNTIQLTQYIGNKTELTVPANYDGYEVYAVGNQNATETPKTCYNVFGVNSLSNTTITKLTIEDGIKEIKTGAFFTCKNISGDLVIPDSVTSIGYAAFLNCQAINGSLTLSENLKEIHYGAFYGCSNMTGTLNLPNGLEVIEDYAFFKCSRLTGNLVIPNNVKSIGYGAFYICTGFTGTLTLSENLITVEDFAFNQCSGLTGDLVIPNSVTSIGVAAFQNCTGFDGNLILSNNLQEIKDNAFHNCTGLTGNIMIPDSVTFIGNVVFQNCTGLTGDLVIPDSVTSMGYAVFQNCKGFTGTLKLSNNLAKIGDYTFNECSGLTGDLVIPDSVTSIGYAAFNTCSGFTGTLTLSENLITVEDFAFNKCNGLTGDLVIPNSVTSIGVAAFQNCTGFDGNLILSNNLQEIKNNAFYNCSGLTGDLIIPNSVTSIGEGAFCNCSGLTGDLIIPNSVTSIGEGAFYKCSGFTGRLTLSNNLKEIKDATFDQCSGLTGDLVIPDSVTSIGASAFQLCGGFNGEFKISKNVEYIGIFAFSKLTNLKNTTIYLPASLSKIGEDYTLNGENVGVSSHFTYNLGANVRNFEAFEVDENNQYFKSVDGVLYTKNGKRLVSYPRNKKDTTYEILEGVEILDQMSIASNMTLQTLVIPDSLNFELKTFPGFTIENYHPLGLALYSYNAIQNIETKDTNQNYKSVDGVVYTKDLKEMVYVSSGRTNEVVIPDGVETIRDKAIYYSQVGRKISKMYIPASVVNISDSIINSLNSFVQVVEVSPDNPVFTVDSNNKLIKK